MRQSGGRSESSADAPAVLPAFLDDALGFNVHRVQLLLRRELIKALAEYRLTPEQWQVLAALRHGAAPLSQRQICLMLLRDKPGVSRILAGLERSGWVAMAESPVDRRVALVRLTPKGSRVAARAPARLRAHFRKVFEALERGEKTLLVEGLKKLRRAMGDSEEPPGDRIAGASPAH